MVVVGVQTEEAGRPEQPVAHACIAGVHGDFLDAGVAEQGKASPWVRG